ncbi:hypothetical protein E2C01_041925 [Portunus trituberculatus]|uniref:Uncharacterized protein n=1 Tax=Portunus trituberculatus TaxID=210409 RepID=A0A5B7FS04_PORTR|nr:hypothetical protein [Portunus trituberculatus]
MPQPGEHTSLAPHKGETQVAEKGTKKHYQAPGDPRMETHSDRCGATNSGTSCSQDGKCGVDNRPGVSVCRSCQHLYAGNVEVVLSPACLEDHLPHPDPANPSPVSVHRPWAARNFGERRRVCVSRKSFARDSENIPFLRDPVLAKTEGRRSGFSSYYSLGVFGDIYRPYQHLTSIGSQNPSPGPG